MSGQSSLLASAPTYNLLLGVAFKEEIHGCLIPGILRSMGGHHGVGGALARPGFVGFRIHEDTMAVSQADGARPGSDEPTNRSSALFFDTRACGRPEYF